MLVAEFARIPGLRDTAGPNSGKFGYDSRQVYTGFAANPSLIIGLAGQEKLMLLQDREILRG